MRLYYNYKFISIRIFLRMLMLSLSLCIIGVKMQNKSRDELKLMMKGRLILVQNFQERRRRSSSNSSASSLFDFRNSEEQEREIKKLHDSITPFYTHSEDVVRVALRVCKRALLEHDDTLLRLKISNTNTVP